MASLHENRHGYLQLRFRWKGIQCSEGFRVRPGDLEAIRLEALAREITREIEAGTFDYLARFPSGNKAHLFRPGGPELFSSFAEKWLEKKAPPELGAATHRDYCSVVRRYLTPAFGSKPLAYFSTEYEEAELILKRELKGLSPRRMQFTFTLLKSMLKYRKIDFSIPYFADSDREREIDFFPPDERDHLLKTFDPFDEPFFTVAFHSGARPSEQRAFRAEKFDFHYKRIPIYTRLDIDDVEGRPKTKRSQRVIDMLPEVEDALIRFRWFRSRVKHVRTEYFFCRKDGTPHNKDHLYRGIWQPAMKKAGLRPRVMYATRHTFASVYLTMGYSPAWVANMMGDNLATVLKHYNHFIKEIRPQLNRSTPNRSEPTPTD